MKKYLCMFMAVCAVLLTGCDRSAGNDLVKIPENFSGALEMYYYNGEKTVMGYIFDGNSRADILNSLSAVSAKSAENWSPEDVTIPVYGVKFGMGENAFEAAWTNGYWITRTGEAYSFDYDFAELWRDYDREGTDSTWSTAAILPCAYYLFRDENGWIADYLSPAGNLPEMPETLAVASTLDEDVLMVEFINSGKREWGFGEFFDLQAQLDGEWYQVPRLPGDWIYIALAHFVMPQQTLEHEYDLSCYGELHEGKYRIVTDSFWAEFYIGN